MERLLFRRSCDWPLVDRLYHSFGAADYAAVVVACVDGGDNDDGEADTTKAS